jgi:hypothetical protein
LKRNWDARPSKRLFGAARPTLSLATENKLTPKLWRAEFTS